MRCGADPARKAARARVVRTAVAATRPKQPAFGRPLHPHTYTACRRCGDRSGNSRRSCDRWLGRSERRAPFRAPPTRWRRAARRRAELDDRSADCLLSGRKLKAAEQANRSLELKLSALEAEVEGRQPLKGAGSEASTVARLEAEVRRLEDELPHAEGKAAAASQTSRLEEAAAAASAQQAAAGLGVAAAEAAA
eukprot:SAG11_NODE_12652_length_692_cov_1.426644_1_plen_193_part_01